MLRSLAEMFAAVVIGATLGSVMVKVGPGFPISVTFSFALILFLYNLLHDVEGDADFIKKIFLISAVGRVILAMLLHNVVRDPATLAGDDAAYEYYGKALAEVWADDKVWSSDLKGRLTGGLLQNVYIYYNAAMFYLLGDNVSLLPKCINAAVGALTPVFFYRIAWHVSNPTTARYSLYLTSLAPSMILWSALNLRDSFAILSITTSIYYTIRLKERFSFGDAAKFMFSMAAVTTMRTYMFVILGLALALSYIGFRRGHEIRDLLVGLLIAFGLIFIFRSFGLGQTAALQNASFEQLHQMRVGLASGKSAYAIGADVSSPLKALLFLPVGVIFFLFAPFPWQLSSFRQMIAFPEVLLFYILFPVFVAGVRRAVRTDLARWLPVLLPALLVTVTYSIVEGNVGTAFRHKAQVLGLYFIFAAYELAARYEARGRVDAA